SLLKTLGQLVFMATIGTSSGKLVVESIKIYGFSAVYVSVFSVLIALILFVLIMKYILKINFMDILGIFSGALTSTPTLTMSNEITKSDYPSISYASTYPFALIMTMLLAQVIGLVF
ncbi:MAG: YidE/YbjL duplication, partial [Calditerrivibrio sp.]|nr:YidE/YbjL duplication [Calditerrivibrio sp.]